MSHWAIGVHLRMSKHDDASVFDREEHYRNLNNELKQKSSKLMQEATDIVNSEKLTNTIIITAQPSQCLPDVDNILRDSSCQREIVQSFDEDTYLGAISKLSSPAKTRFLIAKTRALEEENLKISTELKLALDDLLKQKTRVTELETERGRLQKQVIGNQSQLEKLRQGIDEAKARADTLSIEKSTLEKAADAAHKASELAASSHKTVSLRLNRALDEVERQRSEAEKARATAQDLSDTTRRQVEQLTSENRRLERQKLELINGFKKQMRLIDVLRRQKMLAEASRALKITEEEFIKTLDW